MGEWSFLGELFHTLQAHSPMLGRFWLLLMLIFRILILGTVASDLFEDEQQEFVCNTLQPGCKQVCYDAAFPISHYRFWVFHIVLISTPALVFLVYAAHHGKNLEGAGEEEIGEEEKGGGAASRAPGSQARWLGLLYLINVAFRLLAEVGFLAGQWWLYDFRVKPLFICTRFPCPHTVDCFPSRPMEKTIFLCFYFGVGLVSALTSVLELGRILFKRGCWGRGRGVGVGYATQNHLNIEHEGTRTSPSSPRAPQTGPAPLSRCRCSSPPLLGCRLCTEPPRSLRKGDPVEAEAAAAGF
ncbi:CXD3 protein, partial [Polyodon spathula]|nr:gap junction delta-3 protein-like [Polyodon spathula]MBN3282276.1 CXD3 protein [Polyodon spathula]